MIYFIFLQVWFRSPVISSVIGETGRSFRFGVNPSLCFFRIVVESIICDNDKEMSKALVMTEAFNPNQLLEHNVLKFLFLCCFLTYFIFLSSSCLSLSRDVARYACVTKTANLFDNITNLFRL